MITQVFTIYCHINRVNGKRYVGQTVDTVERWKAHLRAARDHRGSPAFGAAIRKYGAEAFDHELLEVVSTKAEADAAEIKWIKQLNCRVPYGYNLTGGAGGPDYIHETTRTLIGAVHRRLWAKLSPEQRSELVRYKLSFMSPEVKSDRVRKQWANMTPEAREERTRKFVERLRETHATPEYSKKMSDWQTANQATLTSDQKLAVVQKAWATRREKYGQKGSKDISFEQYSEATKRGLAKMTPEQLSARGAKIWATRKERHGERGYSKRKKSHGEAGREGWAKMTPEARAERVQKIKDGQRNVSRSEIAQDSWAKLTPEAHAERVQKIKDGQNRFFSTPEARAEHGRKVREGLRRRREAKEALLAAQRPRLLFNLLEPRVQVST